MWIFVQYVLPPAVAVVNARLGRTSAGLQNFYEIAAFLASTNWLYVLYAVMTYYSTCGGGRNGCSVWRDATVNIPSQLLTADMLLATLLALVFFYREQTRFQTRMLNAWQFLAYTFLGTVGYSLPTYFAAQTRFIAPLWSRQAHNAEHLRYAHATVDAARAQLERRFVVDTATPSQVVRLRGVDGAVLLYAVLLLVSMCVWAPHWDALFVDYHDTYSNFANKFLTRMRLLLHVVVATRSITTRSSFASKMIYLFGPSVSVSTTFAYFALMREERAAERQCEQLDFDNLTLDLRDYKLRPEFDAPVAESEFAGYIEVGGEVHEAHYAGVPAALAPEHEEISERAEFVTSARDSPSPVAAPLPRIARRTPASARRLPVRRSARVRTRAEESRR